MGKAKTKRKEIELTEEEQFASGRVVLRAAFAALGERPKKISDMERKELSKRIIACINTAKKVRRQEEARIKREKGNVYFYLENSVIDAVGSAFAAWTMDLDVQADDASPHSEVGYWFAAFAKVMIFRYQQGEFKMLSRVVLQEDDSIFWCF